MYLQNKFIFKQRVTFKSFRINGWTSSSTDRPEFTRAAAHRPKLIMRMLPQKSKPVWKIENVRLLFTYEEQSANSGPFILLCIVYSNIGHRDYKSSSCSTKTASFVCTVLTDSILCPLTSPPQLPASSDLRISVPWTCINWSVLSIPELWKTIMFERGNVYFMEEGNKSKACCFHHFPRYFPIPYSTLLSWLLAWKIKVYRQFPPLFVSADERAQKVRRNCKRVDTQSDRRAFVWERKMMYCYRDGSNRVHGELWWRRVGAKLWSCWASISYVLSPIQRVCSRGWGKQNKNEFNNFPTISAIAPSQFLLLFPTTMKIIRGAATSHFTEHIAEICKNIKIKTFTIKVLYWFNKNQFTKVCVLYEQTGWISNGSKDVKLMNLKKTTMTWRCTPSGFGQNLGDGL